MKATTTITEVVTLETMHCGSCHVLYAMPDGFLTERRKDHATWYCPNGHPRYYPADNEEERLKKELDKTQTFLANARSLLAVAEREKQELQKEAERLAKRAQAGVCSKCHRSFQNVKAHMGRRHPEPQ